MLTPPLQRYLAKGEPVAGWLDHYSAGFIAELAQIQTRLGVVGGLGEIGVHHGRLFIVLKLAAAPGEKLFALDIFEDQRLNADRSGRGSESAFLRNLARWTGGAADVEIIRSSSLDVTPEMIGTRVGPCRMISIDGGHTEACTYNDLELAERSLSAAGVVVMDDLFNETWPGVFAGAMRYLRLGGALRIFAISPNKTYWALASAHHLYRRELRNSQERYYLKTVTVDDLPVDVYHRQPGWRGMVKRSSIGPLAMRLKQRYMTQ